MRPYKTKISAFDITEIHRLSGEYTQPELAKMFNTTRQNINLILRGKTRADLHPDPVIRQKSIGRRGVTVRRHYTHEDSNEEHEPQTVICDPETSVSEASRSRTVEDNGNVCHSISLKGQERIFIYAPQPLTEENYKILVQWLVMMHEALITPEA